MYEKYLKKQSRMERQKHMSQKSLKKNIDIALLKFYENYLHKKYGDMKKKFFRGLPPSIVEIGPGPGVNFRYYPENTHITAIEPDKKWHPVLRGKAEKFRMKIDIKTEYGENLSLKKSSVKCVVATLVFCSVNNPENVISEILRILKPGGKFIFLEHVAAPEGTNLRMFQEIIKKPWKIIFDGCNVNRNTLAIIKNAGFSIINMQRIKINTILTPITFHIAGSAIK